MNVQIGDCAKIVNGFAFKSDLFTTEKKGLPVIRIRDVVRGRSETYYTGDYPESSVINNGDVLIGMDGEFNIARWQSGKALLNQRVCKIEAKDGVADVGYLTHALANVLKRIEDRTPFVTVKHLSSDDLKEESIPLPDLNEQRRIAGLLERADGLRRTRRYALELAVAFLPAAFLQLFRDWQAATKKYPVKLLEEVVQPGRGVTYGIVQAGPHIPDGVPYIRTGDIVDGVIRTSKLLRTSREIADSYQRSEVKYGDIVMSIRATVGTVAILPPELDGANLTQGTARIAPGDEIKMNFLLWQIRMPETQRWIMRQVKGTTFAEITLAKLRELPVFVPPLPLQKRFSELVERHERLRAKQREALRQAEHLFQTLLHQAFTEE